MLSDCKSQPAAPSTILKKQGEPNLTLVYTDCRGKKFGDYSGAGEFAYAMQKFLSGHSHGAKNA